jgi:hypothetical protein
MVIDGKTQQVPRVGMRFGRLVVVRVFKKRIKSGQRATFCTCLCDCGKKKTLIHGNLTRKKATKSCGCLVKEQAGKIPAEGETRFFRRLYRIYSHAAKTREIEWKLTYEEFVALSKEPCAYCGIEAQEKTITIGRFSTRLTYETNGIDRIFSDLGYSPENVNAACETCNRAKSVLTPNEYIEHCRKVTEKWTN